MITPLKGCCVTVDWLQVAIPYINALSDDILIKYPYTCLSCCLNLVIFNLSRLKIISFRQDFVNYADNYRKCSSACFNLIC
jgi:hypothetical protein